MQGGHFLKRTVRDVPLAGKTVLLRADYNVPLSDDGAIDDDFRIRASLPTLRYLIAQKCKIVVISHLGRPDGRDESLSLKPVAKRLGELVDVPVVFASDCIGDAAKMAAKNAPAVSIVLFENLRFYKQEEANDQSFAKQLTAASGARYFIEDGFGVVHRAHASTAAITQELPSVAGLLLEKEVTAITGVMSHPEHPLVAVLGGAKVRDKIAVIEALIPIADQFLVGGAMANTFLLANGVSVGKSKAESDEETEVKKIYSLASKRAEASTKEFIRLPDDVAVASSVDSDKVRQVKATEIGADDMALDIGEKTIETYVEAIERAKTVIWNGTLGFAEHEAFAHGSARIALALATHPNIISVIGGGDTADFVLHWDSKEGGSFSHVSTGGGASLELMAGEKLPGVESLLDAPK